jgi:enoyl-CoA hydratase/carnithine racemase
MSAANSRGVWGHGHRQAETPHPAECSANAGDALSRKRRGRSNERRDPLDAQETWVTKPLLIEHDDGVDRVTLNRPDSLNALDPALIDALNDYFQGLQRNRSTRVVVLRGAGPAFCAGLDLKDAMKRHAGQQEPPSVTDSLDLQRRIADIVMLMRRCPQPIIALVQGAAAGGGFALALAADIRIATKSARMNCAFIKLGLGGCDIGTSYFLPRLVGVSVASELILTGRFIGAERALAVGLVSEVVEEGGLDAAAAPYLDAMMTASPVGLRLSKECLNMSVDAGSIEAVIAMEDRNQVLCSRSEDFSEGIKAFIEKRKPVYIRR